MASFATSGGATNPAHPGQPGAFAGPWSEGLPLIWFRGVASAAYLPLYPVYLVAEEPHYHQFVVALNRGVPRLFATSSAGRSRSGQ